MITHRIVFGSRPGDDAALVAFLTTEISGVKFVDRDGEEFLAVEPLFVVDLGAAASAAAVLANRQRLRAGDMVDASEIG